MQERRSLAIAACAMALMAGCKSPSQPTRPDVRLNLAVSAASAGPGDSITAAAVANNVGKLIVYRWEICCGYELGLWVIDVDGRHLRLYPPQELCGCPDVCCVDFQPGEFRRIGLTFKGIVYDELGAPHVVSPGEYTIVAAYTYYTARRPGVNDGATHLEKRATFTWDPPPPKL